MNAPSFLRVAAEIATPPALSPFRNMASVRTIFDTRHPYDASLAGFDGPCEPGSEGFSVTFDGRWSVPTAQILLTDNEVIGAAALEQLDQAILEAAKMARRQEGA